MKALGIIGWSRSGKTTLLASEASPDCAKPVLPLDQPQAIVHFVLACRELKPHPEIGG
jgi:hypothetical protein